MNQPTLGDQLRSDKIHADRRREDATALAKALDVAAQLADQCDRLLAENAELQREVERLSPEPESVPGDDFEPDKQ